MKKRRTASARRRTAPTVNAAAARIAFMRFGLGPKPGALARLGTSATAARDACLRELGNPRAVLLPDSAVLFTAANGVKYPLTMANCCNAAALLDDETMMSNGSMASEGILPVEMAARIAKKFEPEVGFVERLVMFWSNHFSIFWDKANLTHTCIGHFERNVIRTNVLGNFYDMLLGATMHPAMLTYLDNVKSIGPNSIRGKKRGSTYNENFAREILELHTLGVFGGYSQADVTNFAKVLTGWQVAGNFGHGDASKGGFMFDPELHEPGSFTIMGKTFTEQTDGVNQGIAVLKMLATHPATAQHIAYKLLRHFVSDAPDPKDVATIARSFTASGGNLLTVSKALISLPSAWSTQLNRICQPEAWVVSMARALALNPAQVADSLLNFTRPLTAMGQLPFGRITPDGYPDDNYYWFTENAVRLRMELALSFVSRFVTTKVSPGARPAELASSLLGASLPAESAAQLATFTADDRPALAFLFSTPEYLRR